MSRDFLQVRVLLVGLVGQTLYCHSGENHALVGQTLYLDEGGRFNLTLQNTTDLNHHT